MGEPRVDPELVAMLRARYERAGRAWPETKTKAAAMTEDDFVWMSQALCAGPLQRSFEHASQKWADYLLRCASARTPERTAPDFAWDEDFAWVDAPTRPGVKLRTLSDFEIQYGQRAPVAPSYTIDRYGSTFSITRVPARPRWKRILLWPRDRWVAWQFDRRTG